MQLWPDEGGGGQEFEHATHQQFKCQRVAPLKFEIVAALLPDKKNQLTT